VGKKGLGPLPLILFFQTIIVEILTFLAKKQLRRREIFTKMIVFKLQMLRKLTIFGEKMPNVEHFC
jgi:hypothetical protein